MNFLIDVHLPISLSKFLSSQKDCTSTHVNQVLQKWRTTDAEICKYADENSMVVVTKDQDFKNSHFINKTPKKVIRVTLGNIANNELIQLFDKYLPFILPQSEKAEIYIEISNEQLIFIDS
jgi:predicted nuclease of predicted toxin-antitoxin system